LIIAFAFSFLNVNLHPIGRPGLIPHPGILLLVIVFALVIGLVGLIGYGLYSLVPFLGVLFIVLAVILVVVFVILFIYSLEVVLLPIPVFFTYYRLEFYKSLSKSFK